MTLQIPGTDKEKDELITDMYEALSEVLGYAEEYGGMAFAGETGRTRDYFLQAIDKSQKALSKAEGKSITVNGNYKKGMIKQFVKGR